IIPPSNLNLGVVGALAYQFKRNFVTAFASGWAGTFSRGTDKQFPLSSHGDFNQVLSYIEQSNPKQVYTVYGFANEMAQAIRRRTGIKAESLVKKKQADLTQFC
ncbi:MAG: hypothetical protein GOV15_02165, partial [Candidatus Diapherotrites archaeon]|nr:hypothetical protein [Candidatus Diapherotrites archaeon]